MNAEQLSTFGSPEDPTPFHTAFIGIIIAHTLCCELAAQLPYDVAWQVGDVARADHFLMMRGRHAFEGSRTVLASLSSIGWGLKP